MIAGTKPPALAVQVLAVNCPHKTLKTCIWQLPKQNKKHPKLLYMKEVSSFLHPYASEYAKYILIFQYIVRV